MHTRIKKKVDTSRRSRRWRMIKVKMNELIEGNWFTGLGVRVSGSNMATYPLYHSSGTSGIRCLQKRLTSFLCLRSKLFSVINFDSREVKKWSKRMNELNELMFFQIWLLTDLKSGLWPRSRNGGLGESGLPRDRPLRTMSTSGA